MWQLQQSPIEAGCRWQLHREQGQALSFADVLRGWTSSEPLRERWIGWLRALALEAYVWECPPVTAETLSRPFECVFLSSPSLARMRPEPEVFASHFRPDRQVVSFGNLGGDALLIAPCPADDARDFSHLAQFVRAAEPSRQAALWQRVGEDMGARVGADPLWLSTAGHGVAWLHVRLDSSPKYYWHTPYARR